MNKITAAEYPELFEAINEDYDPIHRESEHRRGSNFFTTDIIQIDETWLEWVPNLTPEVYGLWQTETYVRDTEYGSDDVHTQLTRVEAREKVVTTIEYVPIY